MNDLTVGPDWSGLVHGPDFGSEILFDPVHGLDFHLVRYVVRSLVRIFLGQVRGPEVGRKIRSGADNHYYDKLNNKSISTWESQVGTLEISS